MTTEKDMATHDEGRKRNALMRLWTWFWRPAPAIALGTLLSVGFVVGVAFWGSFNWAMEATNTEQFCITCHEMRENVYQELKETVHYTNRSGVRATCPDCHVPREWHYKIVRKIQASNEVLHKVLGTIDTREKFEAKRLQLATSVWKTMKQTDSRECRNCHLFNQMDYMAQEPRSARLHQEGLQEGKTCIDCHRGIAHTLPDNADSAYQKLLSEISPKK